jgi:hypothetical protein
MGDNIKGLEKSEFREAGFREVEVLEELRLLKGCYC